MLTYKTGELTVDADTTVLMEGANSPLLFTVFSGMGTRHTTLENGRHQIISFFPFEFIGLQGPLMGGMKHSVEESTPMVRCTFRRSDLRNPFRSNSDRAHDLTWIATVEEHVWARRSRGCTGDWRGLPSHRETAALCRAGAGRTTDRCRCRSSRPTSPMGWGCLWSTPTRPCPVCALKRSRTGLVSCSTCWAANGWPKLR